MILKVQFLADGQIGKIDTVRLLPHLTDLAREAAGKIRFEPEVISGISVNRTVVVEYDYHWHGLWKVPPILVLSSGRQTKIDTQAEAILKKAIQSLGGNNYLQVKTQIGRGKFSVIREGAVVSFQSFTDVIVLPDKERTEFKGGGVKSVQTNVGNTGWTFDGDNELIKVQNEKQIDDFKRSVRVSLDNLLRGGWRNDAALAYVGKRAATLGKRNDVIKLTYKDGLVVEFEFASDDALPQKAIYTHLNADGGEVKEEDRYAQFNDISGVKSPFIIDRFVNGVQSSRINYESIEFNKTIPDAVFAKPASPKELKKDLKL